jgi:hypothetical protein
VEKMPSQKRMFPLCFPRYHWKDNSGRKTHNSIWTKGMRWLNTTHLWRVQSREGCDDSG